MIPSLTTPTLLLSGHNRRWLLSSDPTNDAVVTGAGLAKRLCGRPQGNGNRTPRRGDADYGSPIDQSNSGRRDGLAYDSKP